MPWRYGIGINRAVTNMIVAADYALLMPLWIWSRGLRRGGNVFHTRTAHMHPILPSTRIPKERLLNTVGGSGRDIDMARHMCIELSIGCGPQCSRVNPQAYPSLGGTSLPL